MSDQSQGEGWWMASDAKWYPPQGPSPSARVVLAGVGAGAVAVGVLGLAWMVSSDDYLGDGLSRSDLSTLLGFSRGLSDSFGASTSDNALPTTYAFLDFGWLFALAAATTALVTQAMKRKIVAVALLCGVMAAWAGITAVDLQSKMANTGDEYSSSSSPTVLIGPGALATVFGLFVVTVASLGGSSGGPDSARTATGASPHALAFQPPGSAPTGASNNGPIWSVEHNAYLQWNPDLAQWFRFDNGTQAWVRLT